MLKPPPSTTLAPTPSALAPFGTAGRRGRGLRFCAAVLAATLVARAADARAQVEQSPDPDTHAPPARVVEDPSDQAIEFGVHTITGKVTLPGGSLVLVRPRGHRRQLIGLRSSFRAELRQTVDAL